MFSDLDAFIGGELDAGLFYFAGNLAEGVTMEAAEKGIEAELDKLKNELVPANELRKVKNKVQSAHMFSEISALNKAMHLATSELIGDANLVNTQLESYEAVTAEDIQELAKDIFRKKKEEVFLLARRK